MNNTDFELENKRFRRNVENKNRKREYRPKDTPRHSKYVRKQKYKKSSNNYGYDE